MPKMEFPALINFLKIKGQYPFSWKRNLINKFISLLSYIPGKGKKEYYDVLFILDTPNTSSRYNTIIEAILKDGFSCLPVFFSKRQIDILAFKGALLSKEVLTTDFATQKGFALFLKNRYSPSIIIHVDDCSFISTFIKKYSGAQLINIAHCVSCPTVNFDILDYHYYFLFGASSIINLKKNRNSYGRTKAIQIGSLFLDEGKRKYTDENKKETFFLFSSQWLSPTIADDIKWARSIINELAERNPGWKIIVKLHPLETELDWVSTLPNISIGDKNISFREMLTNVSWHLTHHSAFAIEASVCDVPTVCIQRKEFIETCLGFREVFPVVDNVYELEKILKGGLVIKENIKAFRDRHLVNIGNELNYFISVIHDIMSNSEIPISEDLIGTFYD